MATKINSAQILDGAVTRNDLNTTTSGQAVTTKVTQGSNVTLTSTGVDSGTGDVKVTAVPSGSSGQVQFNSAGSFSGATNVTISSSGSIILGADSTPSTPPTNSVILYTNNVANKGFLKAMDSYGTAMSLQSSFARNRIVTIIPSGAGSSTITVTGIPVTSAQGSQGLRSVSATNFATRLRRVGQVTSTTAGTLAEYRQTSVMFSAGTAGTYPTGGFLYVCRFSPSNAAAVSGERFYNGMINSLTNATNVEPNTQTNHIGIAQLSTDANQFYWVYGGTTAQTSIACGTAVGSPSSLGTQAFELAIYAPATSTNTFYGQLTNLETGVSVSQTFTGGAAVVPANNVFLGFKIWKTNNATAAASAFDLINIYMESDN